MPSIPWMTPWLHAHATISSPLPHQGAVCRTLCLRSTRTRTPTGGQSKIIYQPGIIELDPYAEGYTQKPLDWAPTPQSFCRRLFDGTTIEKHLTALANRQQADGGWPISWGTISPAVEIEWRGRVTIEALRTL